MAAIITSSSDAAALLEAACPHDSAPVLTDGQMTALLARWAIATVWDDATAYVYGQYVVPVAGAPAYLYRVARNTDETWGGTSGATAPTWDTSTWLADGTLHWEYVGPAPACIWDIRSAAREGWLMKAASVAGCVDITDGALRAANSQQHAMCIQQADRYKAIGIF
jgi:hypothetical protein